LSEKSPLFDLFSNSRLSEILKILSEKAGEREVGFEIKGCYILNLNKMCD
jgi:hypothetical protein